MPELIAKSALDGRRLALGNLALAEVDPGPITGIAVFPGQLNAVSKGLKALGLPFPGPNSFSETNEARIVWTGRDQAFLTGTAPPAMEGAAITDQTGGWAVLALSGAGSASVLARLVPVDLRLSAVPVGGAFRSGLNHMNAIVLRTQEHGFEIMVFRSMARTAWHELQTSMAMVAARAEMKSQAERRE